MRIDIYMACPLCLQYRYNCSKEYWRHGSPDCNGILTLDERAWVHCSGRCGNKAHLLDMSLTCSSGRHSFAVVSIEGFAQAISMASMGVTASATTWLQNVLHHIQR